MIKNNIFYIFTKIRTDDKGEKEICICKHIKTNKKIHDKKSLILFIHIELSINPKRDRGKIKKKQRTKWLNRSIYENTHIYICVSLSAMESRRMKKMSRCMGPPVKVNPPKGRRKTVDTS